MKFKTITKNRKDKRFKYKVEELRKQILKKIDNKKMT